MLGLIGLRGDTRVCHSDENEGADKMHATWVRIWLARTLSNGWVLEDRSEVLVDFSYVLTRESLDSVSLHQIADRQS